MKVLNFSLDGSILNTASKTSERVVEYAGLVDNFTVIAPGKKSGVVKLSERAVVYGVSGGNKLFQLFNIYKKAQEILKKGNFTIISVQDTYYLAFLALILARKNKIGLEIQVHGFEKYSGIRKMIAFFVIPRADAVKTISKRLKKKLIEEFGVEEAKITIAPIYTPVKDIQLAEDRNDKRKITFVTIGRLVEVKNISMQIEAMKELSEKHNNVELWIVGEGPLMADLKNKVSELKLENNVKFLGWQEDLDSIYKQADIFVLSSDSEGWGMVVVEAAVFSLPIIMTDVGCAGELIKNNESGIVVPVHDKDALLAAMEDLVNDREKGLALGKGARREVEKRPSKEDIFELYLKSWRIAAGSK